MKLDSKAQRVAEALVPSVSLLMRRIRQTRDATLTPPETSALARLDQAGPSTVTALAKCEGISAQSMGATLGGLEARGLIKRSADPQDGRQTNIAITRAGRDTLRSRHDARTQQFARALSEGFAREELEQLLLAAPLLERFALKL